MSKKLQSGLCAALTTLLLATAVAQTITRDQLVGEWEFTAYAERSTPNERVPVGVRMEIRADGTVLTQRSNGVTEDRYRLDGAMLIYIGARGEQRWTVRSFEGGKTLVLENSSTLMYWEKI